MHRSWGKLPTKGDLADASMAERYEFRYNPGLVSEASVLHELQCGAIAVLNTGFDNTGAINVFITTAAGDEWKPR